MERPFAVIGFSWIAALTTAFYLGINLTLWICAFFTVLFIITLIIPKLRREIIYSVVLGSAIFSMLSFCFYYGSTIAPIESTPQTDTKITAQLCDIPYERNGIYWYIFETESIDGSYPQNIKIQLSSSKALNMDLYDKITAEVTLYEYDTSSYGSYNRSKGIQFNGYIHIYSDVNIEKIHDKPLYYYALSLRQAISDKIEQLLPQKQSNFLQAVLLGNKNVYTADEKANFSSAGVSHIIAVSGFHLSVLTQMILLIFSVFFKRRTLPAVFSAVFVLMFMAITGFSPSVLRAGIMQLIVLLGIITYRQADTLNSLGLAVLLICIFNPYAVADIGLLLSFSATLGIAVWYQRLMKVMSERIFSVKDVPKPRLRDKLKQPITSVLSMLSVTVSALIFSMPVSILSFQNIALYSVLTNFLITIPASIIIGAAIIMIICGFIPLLLPFAHLLAVLCGVLSNFVLNCISIVSSLPYAVISLQQKFVPLWISGTILLVVFAYILKKRRGIIKYTILMSILMLAVGLFSEYLCRLDCVNITITDVGEGISVVLTINGHTSVLFSNATEYSSLNYLYDEADIIDYFLLASWEESHSAEKLLENLKVDIVEVYNEEKAYERLYQRILQCDTVIPSDADEIHTVKWQNITIQSLERNNVVYIRIQSNKYCMLILPQNANCTDIPLSWQNTDFCVVSDKIKGLEQIQMTALIISSDKQQEKELVSYYYTLCDSVYTTCGNGNLSILIFDNQTISIGRET